MTRQVRKAIFTDTERTTGSMNPMEASAGTALWNDMVEQDQNEPEGITIFPFENCRENRDEQLSAHSKAATSDSNNIQLDKEQAQASAPSVTPHSRYPTAHSGYVQRQSNYHQASAAYAAPYSGYDQQEWKSKQAPQHVQGYFQNTSTGQRQPPEFHCNQMNHQVDDLRCRLQKKNNFLTREKEMRIAAEKDSYLQREKIPLSCDLTALAFLLDCPFPDSEQKHFTTTKKALLGR